MTQQNIKNHMKRVSEFSFMLSLTFECDDGYDCWQAQGVGMEDQVIRLQGVRKRNPHQITKSQHEAKTIMHQVHGGQDSLLGNKHIHLV